MLDAAREALLFAQRGAAPEFVLERQRTLAIIKDLEIIGEAAGKITEVVRQKYEEIPWQDIIGMRNHLIHAYFDIDATILEQTIKQDLPLLVARLETILK